MNRTYITILLTALSVAFVYAQNNQKDTVLVQNLKEVTVTGKNHKYQQNRAKVAHKMDIAPIANPMLFNTISSELLKDQQITNFNDALKNATGISRIWENTGRGGDGAEFYTLRGFSVQPTLINGLASLTNGTIDPINIEQIDVLKGPAGTLYGGNVISYGGLINTTTKTPKENFSGNVGYVTGSNNLNRLTADVNTPVNNKTYVRFVSAYSFENSFRDNGFAKNLFFAPSIRHQANEKLSFSLQTTFQNQTAANAPMVFLSRFSPLSFNNLDVFSILEEKSFTSDQLTIANISTSFQGEMNYIFNKNWSSKTVIARSTTTSDGYYQYLWDSANGDEFTRFLSNQNGTTYSTNIQQNFLGNFNTGTIKHQALTGFDYFQKNIRNNSTGWVALGTVSLLNGTDTGILTAAGADEALKGAAPSNSAAETTIKSIYFSDLITFNPNVQVLLGARVDNFSGIPSSFLTESIDNQTTISPKVGVVFQPLPQQWSLFGNYMNGFQNIDPVQVADLDGSNPTIKVFEPEQADQWEIGSKWESKHKKWNISGSYYHILVSNKVISDPNNINSSIQGGEVESKGYELSITARPIKGLDIIAGFANNHTEVTKDTPNGGYLGLRPEESGPETLVNFWANYRLAIPSLQNFSIGFGGNYASEQLTLNRINIGTFTLPSYSVLNAALTYTNNSYSATLKVNNLADNSYFTGWSTVSPQMGRNISLGAQYSF